MFSVICVFLVRDLSILSLWNFLSKWQTIQFVHLFFDQMHLIHAWSRSKHHHLIKMTKNYDSATYRNCFMSFELFSPFTNNLNHILFPFLPLHVSLRFIVLRHIYLSMHVSAHKYASPNYFTYEFRNFGRKMQAMVDWGR